MIEVQVIGILVKMNVAHIPDALRVGALSWDVRKCSPSIISLSDRNKIHFSSLLFWFLFIPLMIMSSIIKPKLDRLWRC